MAVVGVGAGVIALAAFVWFLILVFIVGLGPQSFLVGATVFVLFLTSTVAVLSSLVSAVSIAISKGKRKGCLLAVAAFVLGALGLFLLTVIPFMFYD